MFVSIDLKLVNNRIVPMETLTTPAPAHLSATPTTRTHRTHPPNTFMHNFSTKNQKKNFLIGVFGQTIYLNSFLNIPLI